MESQIPYTSALSRVLGCWAIKSLLITPAYLLYLPDILQHSGIGALPRWYHYGLHGGGIIETNLSVIHGWKKTYSKKEVRQTQNRRRMKHSSPNNRTRCQILRDLWRTREQIFVRVFPFCAGKALYSEIGTLKINQKDARR